MELDTPKQKFVAGIAALAIVAAVAAIVLNLPKNPATPKDAGIGRPAVAGGGVEPEGAQTPYGPNGEPRVTNPNQPGTTGN